ncbi:M55 family metallopeptidase [Lutispora thermophila]|uniref:D-amino peptidase n=1 Tax=Lutispora thermophila DSM 19022 TaxID=1122184 RepID=A0A1M6H7X9_9FIRM|nr:M55 family metallopeptidase [Lutispora thermophila]SHJ18331.1 D-amino peptidase [Lutispora thermophila DSM 19022]
MKVFISADMEGITSTIKWEECNANDKFYSIFAEQMTDEVVAACEGAIAAGADEIVIKDAHNGATNIDITKLPDCAKIIRGWSGHPYTMVEGIDSTFDAAMFVGYHSAAGREGNPLSHTMTRKPLYIKINGEYASEFMLYSFAAAYEGVPTVFLSGDKMLCEDAAKMHPGVHTVAVKEGQGASAMCMSTKKSLRLIREKAEQSLKQNLNKARISLSDKFNVDICFKDHMQANKMSFYPGMKKLDNNRLLYETDDYFEVLRMVNFVL